MRLIITGTPGVGKHTIAGILANVLSAKVIDVNDIVFKYNTIIGREEDGTVIVDIDRLRMIIKNILDDNFIVVGHLAQDIVDNVDYAIVLRRSPYELEEVYKNRGYNEKKMKDNLASEILGIILYECISKFGKERIIEIDCSNKKPERIVKEILKYIKNKEYKIGVDWLSLVSSKNDMRRFFDV